MYFRKMKLQNIFLFILITSININGVFCQNSNMEHKIENTKNLGREVLIKKAKSILKEKYPSLKINLNEFEVTAWSNKKKVLVHFKRFIKFTPLGYKKGHFNYNFSVNVITKSTLPFDVFGTTQFYTPTKEDTKKIAFVKKSFNVFKPGFENEVFEKNNMYILSISNDTYFVIHHIDKITGEEIPKSTIQGNWEPDPFETADKDPLIEIIK